MVRVRVIGVVGVVRVVRVESCFTFFAQYPIRPAHEYSILVFIVVGVVEYTLSPAISSEYLKSLQSLFEKFKVDQIKKIEDETI